MICDCCNFFVKKELEKQLSIDYKHQKAGYVLIDSDEKTLVVKSASNKWGFPKGSVEKGETLKDCADRELMEETGIDARYLPHECKTVKCNNVIYFIVKDVNFNNFLPFNLYEIDVLGIGIVSITCLKKCDGSLVTSNIKQFLKKFLPTNQSLNFDRVI
ncbi:putative antimutator GTP pyrophosphohydrolase MutT [Lymphocystis disease virus 4]|uniref:Putative antimutator GTP pyrophosphohydrolase MutT n=1 Tax=Lymphocystis disease virus 4 TaxID=2704413 RepID=A0A6B9XM60_9VIRU|nr:putative antimutator GTP pyrophosphohydrolase MutT [Lymphocystis disease virus 4]QHR78527.1 putative antimutator GTP pyrophosphohydrolase MutT [Lymphocystis disease virus 4]